MGLNYTIKRSPKRRKLTITVERDRSVVVHAPIGASAEQIEEIVRAKRMWIHEKTRHAQKYQAPHPPGKEVVSGEAALYLGRNYRIEIAEEGVNEVQFNHHFLIPRHNVTERKQVLRQWYISKAEEKILPKVARHARELGVKFANARIIDCRYRWGSCTANDSVNFNWRLIKAPAFVIDYIIVHELAHLLEANHSEQFWNIVNARLPSACKAKAWLKRFGQLLEEDV